MRSAANLVSLTTHEATTAVYWCGESLRTPADYSRAQEQARRGSPWSPQGHRLIAAMRVKLAGKLRVPAPKELMHTGRRCRRWGISCLFRSWKRVRERYRSPFSSHANDSTFLIASLRGGDCGEFHDVSSNPGCCCNRRRGPPRHH